MLLHFSPHREKLGKPFGIKARTAYLLFVLSHIEVDKIVLTKHDVESGMVVVLIPRQTEVYPIAIAVMHFFHVEYLHTRILDSLQITEGEHFPLRGKSLNLNPKTGRKE